MAGLAPLCWFTWHPFGGHLGLYKVLFRYGHEACKYGLQDLSVITYENSLQDIDIVVIDCISDFWKKLRSTIDCPIYPGDDCEWSIIEFKEWRATKDLCFIIDLSVLDPLNPRLLADILRDYALKFEVKVESTFRDLRECLT